MLPICIKITNLRRSRSKSRSLKIKTAQGIELLLGLRAVLMSQLVV